MASSTSYREKRDKDKEKKDQLGYWNGKRFVTIRKGISNSKTPSKPSPAAFKAAGTDKVERRLPKGDERTDRMSKAAKELRDMQKRSKDRQNAQMPKKPEKKPPMSRNERNRRRRQGR